MNEIYLSFQKNIQKLSNPKIGLLFIFLIILQFSLLPLIPIEIKTEADYNKYVDYSYLYVLSSYTIILFGLIIFHTNKLEILSDHLTLGLIIFSCLIRYSLHTSRELVYVFYLFFVGIVVLIYLVANRKTIMPPDFKIFSAGLLWSIVTLIIITFVHNILDSNQLVTPPQNLLLYIVKEFLFQISFVTVIEEILFRGLIFGFLILNGYKEDTAFFIQGILFWAIHFTKISNPILFFISIPILTISTTLIMRKYKSLYLPIMVHTIVNVFTTILASV